MKFIKNVILTLFIALTLYLLASFLLGFSSTFNPQKAIKNAKESSQNSY
jgi:hypothetical protein